MIRKIHIVTCEFKTNADGRSTFGYMVYDCYGTSYNNAFGSIQETLDYLKDDLADAINSMSSFDDVDVNDENVAVFINDKKVDMSHYRCLQKMLLQFNSNF